MLHHSPYYVDSPGEGNARALAPFHWQSSIDQRRLGIYIRTIAKRSKRDRPNMNADSITRVPPGIRMSPPYEIDPSTAYHFQPPALVTHQIRPQAPVLGNPLGGSTDRNAQTDLNPEAVPFNPHLKTRRRRDYVKNSTRQTETAFYPSKFSPDSTRHAAYPTHWSHHPQEQSRLPREPREGLSHTEEHLQQLISQQDELIESGQGLGDQMRQLQQRMTTCDRTTMVDVINQIVHVTDGLAMYQKRHKILADAVDKARREVFRGSHTGHHGIILQG